jgi:hypothetical protein
MEHEITMGNETAKGEIECKVEIYDRELAATYTEGTRRHV